MRIIWTIAAREYKRYFSTSAGYLVAFFFLLLIGYLFNSSLNIAIYNQTVFGVQTIISPLVFLLVFTTPAITMRLFSEELRMGTVELLFTAPIKDWETVLGKWLGGFLFIITLVAITLLYPLVLNQMIDPGIDIGPLISGYLGVILVCAALIGIGVMISTMFQNQIAAFFVTLGLLLLIWLIGPTDPGSQNNLLTYLNIQGHFYGTFIAGIIDLRDVTYFLSLTIISLFMGSVIVESRRWR